MMRLDRKRNRLRLLRVLLAASCIAVCVVNCAGRCFGLSGLTWRDDIIMALERSSGTVGSDGCEFRVDLPARSKSGAPLDLVLTLDNRGNRTRFWGDTNGLRDCIMRVYDSQGRRVAYTSLGKAELETAGYSTYRCVITELAPGESHEWRFNIAPFFQFRPGRYNFTAWIDLEIPDGPRLKVENVRFEVL